MKPLSNFIIVFCYVGLSLLIGEVHPFTLVPMYNRFSNWAYSFYLSDAKEQLIPVAEYFDYPDDEMSHNYSAICESEKIPYGNRVETPEQLSLIGKKMIEQLNSRKKKSLAGDTIRLHRVCYFIQNDTIASADAVMYEEIAQ